MPTTATPFRGVDLFVALAVSLPIPVMGITLAIYEPLLHATFRDAPTAIQDTARVDRILYGGLTLATVCALIAIGLAMVQLSSTAPAQRARRKFLVSALIFGILELVGLFITFVVTGVAIMQRWG